jgi:hypothetical protein
MEGGFIMGLRPCDCPTVEEIIAQLLPILDERFCMQPCLTEEDVLALIDARIAEVVAFFETRFNEIEDRINAVIVSVDERIAALEERIDEIEATCC